MTNEEAKKMKLQLKEANQFVEEKLDDVFEEMVERFDCNIHPIILQNFASFFISNAIENYMFHHDLDKANKEHRDLMLKQAIEATKSAAQLAFELCDDCMNNTAYTH